jgi:hypothetical protein
MSKELIPFLQKILTVLLNESRDLAYFDAAATSGTLEYNRVKPKL